MEWDITQVEQIFCSYYGISIETLRGRSKTRAILEARQLLWYVLHNVCCYKTAYLASQYGMTKRAIQYGIARVHSLLNSPQKNSYQESCLHVYDELRRIYKPRFPFFSTTPDHTPTPPHFS